MPPSHNVTAPAPASQPLAAPASVASRGPLLVASDGTEASRAALVMAKLLAGEDGDVQCLSVVEPEPIMQPPAEVPFYSPERDAERARTQSTRLREELRGIFGDVGVHADVLVGRPVELLAHTARERHAEMVIAGLRHHGRLERMVLHRETPLRIARTARTPVLVVPQGTTRLPRTVLVAADLDDASVTAARRARRLLRGAERVYVVHVRWGGSAPGEDAGQGWERTYTELTRATFDRIVAAMALPASVAVETRTLTGHPVDELLDFAEQAKVELIVAGYHKRLLAERLTGPRSVAERVFRGASCAMLLVPESAAGDDVPPPLAGAETVVDRASWPVQLAAFSLRNARRAARLEMDTMRFADPQVVRLPLLGTEFIAYTGVVRIMLGGAEPGASRVVHDIPAAASLEIQRTADGKDLALRVAHEGGYSLLTFE